MNHYFTDNRHLAQNRKEITFRFSCFTCHFITDNGVFSKDHVDHGSRVLLEAVHASGKLGEAVLDLGCGYGVIGITLKKAYPDLNWKEGKLLNRMDENGIREWIGKTSKD